VSKSIHLPCGILIGVETPTASLSTHISKLTQLTAKLTGALTAELTAEGTAEVTADISPLTELTAQPCQALPWSRTGHMEGESSRSFSPSIHRQGRSSNGKSKRPQACVVWRGRGRSDWGCASGSYRPRSTVIGSRHQLCVNPGIAKLQGNLLNHACKTACRARSCSW
jgi:hypothetical protein